MNHTKESIKEAIKKLEKRIEDLQKTISQGSYWSNQYIAVCKSNIANAQEQIETLKKHNF